MGRERSDCPPTPPTIRERGKVQFGDTCDHKLTSCNTKPQNTIVAAWARIAGVFWVPEHFIASRHFLLDVIAAYKRAHDQFNQRCADAD